MCGLVALVGAVPGDVVGDAIRGARRRGPHQSGWAILSDEFDQWEIVVSPQPLAAVRNRGRVAIGHSRLATTTGRPGDAPPLHEAQPYVDASDGFVLAHNGTCPHVHWRHREAVVDSMALLLEDGGPAGIAEALDREDAPQAALMADTDGRVWTFRTDPGHPIFVGSGDGWAAASSGPFRGSTLAATGLAMLSP